jgi:hypothetical protein
MTSGIVFILHGPADEPYATELAQSLSSQLPVFPVALGTAQANTQFGMGALCAVLWSESVSRAGLTDAVAAALPETRANALLCRVGSARAPAQLAGMSGVQLNGGDVEADSTALAAAVRAKLAELDGHSGKTRRKGALRSPEKRSKAVAPTNEGGKGGIVQRSAWGLAATLAVVGVAGPFVSDRAGATNMAEPDASNETVSAGATTPVRLVEPAVSPGGVVEAFGRGFSNQVVSYSPPAADPLEATLLAASREPAFEEVATVALTELATADPKIELMLFAAAVDLGYGSWKIEAASVRIDYDANGEGAGDKPDATKIDW